MMPTPEEQIKEGNRRGAGVGGVGEGDTISHPVSTGCCAADKLTSYFLIFRGSLL